MLAGMGRAARRPDPGTIWRHVWSSVSQPQQRPPFLPLILLILSFLLCHLTFDGPLIPVVALVRARCWVAHRISSALIWEHTSAVVG